MGQRRILRALARIYEFHFLEVVIKRKSNPWDVHTF